jgi:hypothetical protein
MGALKAEEPMIPKETIRPAIVVAPTTDPSTLRPFTKNRAQTTAYPSVYGRKGSFVAVLEIHKPTFESGIDVRDDDGRLNQQDLYLIGRKELLVYGSSPSVSCPLSETLGLCKRALYLSSDAGVDKFVVLTTDNLCSIDYRKGEAPAEVRQIMPVRNLSSHPHCRITEEGKVVSVARNHLVTWSVLPQATIRNQVIIST